VICFGIFLLGTDCEQAPGSHRQVLKE
jgi:hypothetical protein